MKEFDSNYFSVKFTTILVLIFFSYQSYSQSVTFYNYSTSNGLSNNDVNAILQDKSDFVWFATEDGLNRFDGYSFLVFRNNRQDRNSISSNSIWALFEDADGYIWAGTKSGEINRYDPKSNSFVSWKIEDKFPGENSITSIFKGKENEVWIGTYKNGLYNLNLKSGEFKNWRYEQNNQKSISNNFVTGIVQDTSGNLWISTYFGLNKLNYKRSKEKFFRYFANSDIGLTDNLIWSISFSTLNPDLLWICTSNGLTGYDIEKKGFQVHNFFDRVDLQFSNSISSIVEEIIEGDQIVWLSTYSGLIRKNLSKNIFTRYLSDESNEKGLINNLINDLYKDKSGVLWIATENGISKTSPKSSKFNNDIKIINSQLLKFINEKDIKASCQLGSDSILFGDSKGLSLMFKENDTYNIKQINLKDNINVWSIVKGLNNDIWIGTYGQGLKYFNLKTGQFKNIEINSPTFQTLAFNFIKSLYIDKNDVLWIGFWGGGIARMHIETGKYEIFINDETNNKSISYNDVWDIHRDIFGRLWIATNGGGLNLFNDDNTFSRIQLEKENHKQINISNILCIYEQASKNKSETIIWIGTTSGLAKLVLNNSRNYSKNSDIIIDLIQYTIDDGLSDNTITDIVEDKNGNLWLGTNNGLNYLNLSDNRFSHYGISDGLPSYEINNSAALNLKANLLLICTKKGIVFFDPEKIRKSDYNPSVVITSFQLFNQNILPGNDSPLKNTITYSNEINLSFSDNVFSFQFAALDFNSPEMIKYAYKMEGFDKDWIFSENRRFVTYTNLSSGTYKFKVKATNSDEVWGENEKSIILNISTPWWRTGWAYMAYFAFVLAGIYLTRRIEINRAKLRNELKMREFESKKQRELENIKSRFFANLSHEFRTPLTLIRGPVEELINGNASENKAEYYKLIKKNSEKLQELIDQLLELTQLENAAIPLKAKKDNIVKVLRGLFYSFESLAKQKNIKIEFNSASHSITCWFDRDKLEKIINNLLSNAFKFTPSGGSISIKLIEDNSGEEKFLVIQISDTGIGIPKDKLGNIFNRFYQVDDSSRKKYGGSGIGLALVKELIDLHKWKIYVESELEKGTIFTLNIPLNDTYLDNANKIFDESTNDLFNDQETNDVINQLKDIDIKIEHEVSESNNFKVDKPSILVVEDSEDVRVYLKSLLNKDYTVNEAVNGEDGLSQALELLPDLIISDVMMPSMNGIEFCQKIKTHWQTSHIPVILLTAKASPESKLEGLETGADDYLTKPFNYRELLVRIKNLLENRRLIKEKFAKDENFKPESFTTNSADREFIEMLLQQVNQNLSDPLFDSEKFAKSVFLSRSQLHRRLQSITGQTTGEFIRTARLKKAAILVREKRFSITQIAYEVGFNSPSHFTKAFKQMFDCLPSEFIDRSNS